MVPHDLFLLWRHGRMERALLLGRRSPELAAAIHQRALRHRPCILGLCTRAAAVPLYWPASDLTGPPHWIDLCPACLLQVAALLAGPDWPGDGELAELWGLWEQEVRH